MLDVHDVSAQLRVHENTVYEWAKTGRLPSIAINGLVRFERQAIENFIEKRKIRLIWIMQSRFESLLPSQLPFP